MQTTVANTPVPSPPGASALPLSAPAETAPARLPALSPEDRTLLHNLIAFREDPVALANHSGLPYLDIIDFTSRPDIALWITHIRALRARNLRDTALAELESCIKTSRDPIERRRAATTILRATDPTRWSRSRKQSQPTRATGTAPPAPPEPNEPAAQARVRITLPNEADDDLEDDDVPHLHTHPDITPAPTLDRYADFTPTEAETLLNAPALPALVKLLKARRAVATTKSDDPTTRATPRDHPP